MTGLEMVRTGNHPEPLGDRVEMAASVAGSVVGALGGVAASAACGLPYFVAAGAIGTMLGSGGAAALARCALLTTCFGRLRKSS